MGLYHGRADGNPQPLQPRPAHARHRRSSALRYTLVNELHARPFPALDAPCHAVYVAIKEPLNAANRNRDADRAHLLALLDKHASAHPQPDATHF